MYKNKGPVTDHDNYSGIALLSCTSTCTFCIACLNQKLAVYVNDNNLGEEQAGSGMVTSPLTTYLYYNMSLNYINQCTEMFIVPALTNVKLLIM